MPRSQSEGPFVLRRSESGWIELSSPDVAVYDQVSIPSFWACVDVGLSRRAPFVVLHDARCIPHVDEAHTRQFLEQLEPRREAIGRYVLAYAAIVSSPMEQGLITAFTWFVRLPLPLRIFRRESEARSFLGARIADENRRQGLALSAE
jgi:hypothetical protein